MNRSAKARETLVDGLRRKVEGIEGYRTPQDDLILSCGSPPLNRLLPEGGLRRGSLIEYLSPSGNSGSQVLAMAAAREACAEEGALVVLNRRREFYPPAAAAWGIDLRRLLLLQPTSDADEVWALDQALRCPGVGAVLFACGPLDTRDFRRLQLAAEAGGTLGLMLRPVRLRGQPTWADVQWQVEPQGTALAGRRLKGAFASSPSLPSSSGWRLRVELVRCRGGTGGQTVILEFDETTGIWQEAGNDHATHPLHSPAELAHPAPARRA